MPVKLDMIPQKMSYQPDWSTTWKQQTCECAPATYGGEWTSENTFISRRRITCWTFGLEIKIHSGMIPYFDPDFYPARFVAFNAENKQKCEDSIYDNPRMYTLDKKTSPCLSHEGNRTKTWIHRLESICIYPCLPVSFHPFPLNLVHISGCCRVFRIKLLFIPNFSSLHPVWNLETFRWMETWQAQPVFMRKRPRWKGNSSIGDALVWYRRIRLIPLAHSLIQACSLLSLLRRFRQFAHWCSVPCLILPLFRMDSDFAPLVAYFSIGAGCIAVAAVMNRLRAKRNRLDEVSDAAKVWSSSSIIS